MKLGHDELDTAIIYCGGETEKILGKVKYQRTDMTQGKHGTFALRSSRKRKLKLHVK